MSHPLKEAPVAVVIAPNLQVGGCPVVTSMQSILPCIGRPLPRQANQVNDRVAALDRFGQRSPRGKMIG